MSQSFKIKQTLYFDYIDNLEIPDTQPAVLQPCTSEEAPLQAVPLFSSCVSMFLVLTWNPPPQVTVHEVHVCHEPQTQLTIFDWHNSGIDYELDKVLFLCSDIMQKWDNNIHHCRKSLYYSSVAQTKDPYMMFRHFPRVCLLFLFLLGFPLHKFYCRLPMYSTHPIHNWLKLVLYKSIIFDRI